ncbi:hypothetical protein, partial [Phocaeicola paurosaccharolyticus]|uniref:hypothetical protein n=1 Tax=Phocaeicola paurosaccharolyticus TaxID=732242 RepID=UPI000469DBCF
LNCINNILNPRVFSLKNTSKNVVIGEAFGGGTSMEQKDNNSFCYINLGKKVLARAVSGTYTFGQALYVTSLGLYSNVESGEIVGYSDENKILSADGYIIVRVRSSQSWAND